MRGFYMFDAAKAYRKTDPSTSKDAAHQATEIATKHHKLILSALSHEDGTGEEIGNRIGLDITQVCRRLPEMQKHNLITVTGEKRVNSKGRKMRVWVKI